MTSSIPFPQLTPIAGIELGAVAAGFKYKGRPDLLLVRFAPGTKVAGVFTQNRVTAAPVKWCKRLLSDADGAARALVVNAGNANAFTGNRGLIACERIAEKTAELVGCAPEEVFLASTGVIGESLTAAPFAKPLVRALGGLSTELWRDAARAIMTTCTFPKAAGRLVSLGGSTAIINGIAKGSGMISPNMATMLGFIFTNAPISRACLQAALVAAIKGSFDSITVDGDTSTNDTILAFTTGAVDGRSAITQTGDPRFAAFVAGLRSVLVDLAKQIVRDGEGASHFVTLDITGAASEAEARQVGMTIANSPLVKTAIAGNDPNWGRLLMAAGRAGVDFDEEDLQLWIGDQLVASGGSVQRSYQEADAAAHMAQTDIYIRLDLGMGTAQKTLWTCDLTHQYIEINADYRS